MHGPPRGLILDKSFVPANKRVAIRGGPDKLTAAALNWNAGLLLVQILELVMQGTQGKRKIQRTLLGYERLPRAPNVSSWGPD